MIPVNAGDTRGIACFAVALQFISKHSNAGISCFRAKYIQIALFTGASGELCIMETPVKHDGPNLPVFRIKGVEELFAYGLNLPDEKYQGLLQQDRDTLIGDLEVLLTYAVDHFDELQQLPSGNAFFVWHAFFLLVDLNATSGITSIAYLLKGDDNLVKYYLGEEPEDVVCHVLYFLSGKQLPVLVDIFKAKKDELVVRFAILEALQQHALRQPANTAQVEACLNDLVSFLTTRINEDDVFIEEVTEHLLKVIAQLQRGLLTDKVKQLVEEKRLPLYDDFNWSDFEQQFRVAEQQDASLLVYSRTRKEYNAERETSCADKGGNVADDEYPDVLESLNLLEKGRAKATPPAQPGNTGEPPENPE